MVVIKINEGTEVWNAGLRQGDQIMAIDGKTFIDFCDLRIYQKSVFSQNKEVILTLKDGKDLRLSRKVFLK